MNCVSKYFLVVLCCIFEFRCCLFVPYLTKVVMQYQQSRESGATRDKIILNTLTRILVTFLRIRAIEAFLVYIIAFAIKKKGILSYYYFYQFT